MHSSGLLFKGGFLNFILTTESVFTCECSKFNCTCNLIFLILNHQEQQTHVVTFILMVPNCEPTVFDNLSPLSVTGSLDVGTGTVEEKIKGKVFF